MKTLSSLTLTKATVRGNLKRKEHQNLELLKKLKTEHRRAKRKLVQS